MQWKSCGIFRNQIFSKYSRSKFFCMPRAYTTVWLRDLYWTFTIYLTNRLNESYTRMLRKARAGLLRTENSWPDLWFSSARISWSCREETDNVCRTLFTKHADAPQFAPRTARLKPNLQYFGHSRDNGIRNGCARLPRSSSLRFVFLAMTSG